jgi:predicted nucleic acid-binding protein
MTSERLCLEDTGLAAVIFLCTTNAWLRNEFVRNILIDAGPLIALFDKDDKYHKAVIGVVAHVRAVLVTTWPVVTETCHMLDFSVDAQLDFLDWASQGGILINELGGADLERIVALTKKYRDRPMDLADASLIVTSEKLDLRQIISIDSDFDFYRRADKKPLENILFK